MTPWNIPNLAIIVIALGNYLPIYSEVVTYEAGFSGVVTQAPLGNPLEVNVGTRVSGHTAFQSELTTFTANDVILTPTVSLQVGLANYIIYPGDFASLTIEGLYLIAVGIINPEGVTDDNPAILIFFSITLPSSRRDYKA